MIIFEENLFLGVITNCEIISWCNLKEYHKEEAIVVACGRGLSE